MFPRLHLIEIISVEGDKNRRFARRKIIPPMRELFKKKEIKGEAKGYPFVQTNKDQDT
jgi:hypothetical protein